MKRYDVVGDNNYNSMIIQSNNSNYRQTSKTEENRRPQMTSQRQQHQQQLSDDWVYQDLKRDIEADGQRHVIEITELDSNGSRLNKIKRPPTGTFK